MNFAYPRIPVFSRKKADQQHHRHRHPGETAVQQGIEGNRQIGRLRTFLTHAPSAICFQYTDFQTVAQYYRLSHVVIAT